MACERCGRLTAAVNDGLARMEGEQGMWLCDPRVETERDRVNRSYNEGVAAAIEAMRAALESAGFEVASDAEEVTP